MLPKIVKCLSPFIEWAAGSCSTSWLCVAHVERRSKACLAELFNKNADLWQLQHLLPGLPQSPWFLFAIYRPSRCSRGVATAPRFGNSPSWSDSCWPLSAATTRSSSISHLLPIRRTWALSHEYVLICVDLWARKRTGCLSTISKNKWNVNVAWQLTWTNVICTECRTVFMSKHWKNRADGF